MVKAVILSTAIVSCLIFTMSKEYGPFDLKISKIAVCKGSKAKDCAILTVQKWNNSSGLTINEHVVENASPLVGKVTVTSKGKQLVRLQMNHPCKHLFLRPIFEKFVNASENCIIRKGYYSYEVNIEKIAKDYFGGSFVYGNLTFKSVMYSRDCNLSCVILDIMMYPAGAVN